MLTTAGSIASILALIFTGWVIFEVRRLHVFYKRHLLLPQYVKELTRLSKNARNALDKKQTDTIKGTLQRCDAVIERIPKYADKTLGGRAQAARDSIARLVSDRDHSVLLNGYEVVNELEAMIQSATAFTGEDRWSTRT